MNIYKIINSIPAHSADQAAVALAALMKPAGPLASLHTESLALYGDTGKNVGIGYYKVSVTYASGEGSAVSEYLEFLDVFVGIETQSGHVIEIKALVNDAGDILDGHLQVAMGNDASKFFYPMALDALNEIGVEVLGVIKMD